MAFVLAVKQLYKLVVNVYNSFLTNHLNKKMTDSSSILLNDFSKLNEDEIFQGEIPTDIAEKCLERCKTYIGGSWANATSTLDITIKRITGGLMNLMMHVHLKKSVPRTANFVYPEEPIDVAIKFFFEKYSILDPKLSPERFNEMNILTVCSQMGISPKVYGIANDGFVQNFHKVRIIFIFECIFCKIFLFSTNSLEQSISKIVNYCKN